MSWGLEVRLTKQTNLIDVMQKLNRMIFLVTKKMESIAQVLRIIQGSNAMSLLAIIKKFLKINKNFT